MWIYKKLKQYAIKIVKNVYYNIEKAKSVNQYRNINKYRNISTYTIISADIYYFNIESY